MEAEPKKPKLIVRIATPQDLKKATENPFWMWLGKPRPAHSKERIAIIALEQKDIVGGCTVDINLNKQNKADIHSLAVEDCFRGTGIGHKLLGKAHSCLLKKGIISAKVFSRNVNLDFYGKAGYKAKRILPQGSAVLYRKITRAKNMRMKRVLG